MVVNVWRTSTRPHVARDESSRCTDARHEHRAYTDTHTMSQRPRRVRDHRHAGYVIVIVVVSEIHAQCVLCGCVMMMVMMLMLLMLLLLMLLMLVVYDQLDDAPTHTE